MSGHLEDLHNLQLMHGVCGSVCVLDILHKTLEFLTVLGQHLGGDIGTTMSRPYLPNGVTRARVLIEQIQTSLKLGLMVKYILLSN